MTPSQKKLLGEQGELTAIDFLNRRGYRIVKHHWRTPFGEIDIIAQRGRAIFFVEVKTRRSDACGEPLEAISRWQRKRIIQGALWFLSETQRMPSEVHFSVIGIGSFVAGQERISFLEDAFEADDFDGFSF